MRNVLIFLSLFLLSFSTHAQLWKTADNIFRQNGGSGLSKHNYKDADSVAVNVTLPNNTSALAGKVGYADLTGGPNPSLYNSASLVTSSAIGNISGSTSNFGNIISIANYTRSGYISVTAGSCYLLSGLLITGYDKTIRFEDGSSNKIGAYIVTSSSYTFTVPAGATKLTFTVKSSSESSVPAISLIQLPTLPLVGAAKNLVDRNNIVLGSAVGAGGGFVALAGSARTTGIPVTGGATYTISGLVDTSPHKYLFFQDALGNTAGFIVTLGTGATTFTAPSAAVVCYYSVQISETWPSLTLMMNIGTSAAAYEDFVPTPAKFLGYSFGVKSLLSPKATSGKRLLLFGDSNTDPSQTAYTGVTGNWPSFLGGLSMTITNRAKSGAAYTYRGGYPPIYAQINAAIAAGDTPDVIAVVCGTNDLDSQPPLGSFTTAMGKSSQAALDTTVEYESVRLAFWKIRQQWKGIPVVAVLPIQRTDYDPTSSNWVNYTTAISQMANRYGVIVRDASKEVGIVRDFEPGTYLYNQSGLGLHMIPAGQSLYATWFTTVLLQILAN